MAVPLDSFFLDPAAPGTLQARIRAMIAGGILSGRMRRGEKLPSTRRLAAHLGVSRITVTLAYAELVASDFLTAKGRAGYYVSPEAPEPPAFQPPPATASAVDWTAALARRFAGQPWPEKPRDWARYRFPFIYGQPDRTLFDRANWRLCALQALGPRDFEAFAADQFDGDDPLLVEFVLRHILPRRGILARPDEVLITLGAQNALWLAAQILLAPGRAAAVEDPCYPALRGILATTGAAVTPVPVDADGLPPQAVPDGTSVIFTTPSHQSPTNATMPRARRLALLDRARALGATVVEDDYEFEIAFLGAPLPALKSLDADGRVIYLGSLSKALSPGLRLGYLVGPAAFLREARALRATVLRHPPGHVQRTAAHFLSLGHYDAQIHRIGRAFRERRAVMAAALEANGLTVAGSAAFGGSSFWMRAPEGTDTTALAARLRDREVLIEPGAPFFAGDAPPRHFYRLAYSSIDAGRISEGVARIAEALAENWR